MASTTYTISAVQLEDMAEIGQISAHPFATDRQTQMKNLGSKPYDMKEITMHSFGSEELPRLHGKPLLTAASDTREAETEPEQKPTTDRTENDDASERLQALTGADMEKWMEEVMPEGARCLYNVIGLSVSPEYQGRGVGSALLRWGTRICDDKHVFGWVHWSEGAWKMYERGGFQVVRVLDVDLDEYAPAPAPAPNEEGPGGKMGTLCVSVHEVSAGTAGGVTRRVGRKGPKRT
ncbi:hypothetical protein E4U53_000962 [Claviceps sorghi]|nr:hypothetical protein E4U53_000962 [Claviceps sorghi]